jgi:citrate synthase
MNSNSDNDCYLTCLSISVKIIWPGPVSVAPELRVVFEVGFWTWMIYHSGMNMVQDRLPKEEGWPTSITRIEPDRVDVAGCAIRELVGKRSLPEAAHLLIKHAFPGAHRLTQLNEIVFEAAARPPPSVFRVEGEDVSKTVARHLLADEEIAAYPADGLDGECGKTVFCTGRVVRYIGSILGRGGTLGDADPDEPFSHWLYRVFTDDEGVCTERARMLEALVVSCMDHGFTPPSTQACVLAASTRVPYEVGVAIGVGSITEVHGGASGGAAEFYADFLHKARYRGTDRSEVLEALMRETMSRGLRIPGLGHRIHTADPRCDALWSVAEETGVAAECVRASKLASNIFSRIRGTSLPMNVDGVIGAIVADMGLPPVLGTLVFILGRVAGLSAHYFEEVNTFPAMRWINFSEAVYVGK